MKQEYDELVKLAGDLKFCQRENAALAWKDVETQINKLNKEPGPIFWFLDEFSTVQLQFF